MWTGETPVIWLKEAEDIVRQHDTELCRYGWNPERADMPVYDKNGIRCVALSQACEPVELTEAERREAVEAMTARIIKEAFALEGIPIKAIFAENLLGQAALSALLERYELRRRK
ncbi:hypothetical protein FRUB_04085 [Fimbriiglobus ruber]|uniref:Uncharacterized protein n=2 Tax=Fimbriiglobus ruber TaxID=1908690 RepID=A0A225E0W6_9BACT|nr:hypothetical protein FRUB_04085 [Fimbriiglobus ruber]